MNDQDPPAPKPSPKLGEHSGQIESRTPTRPEAPAGQPKLPLDGVRVLDLTAWWAGPVAAGTIAALGADVIHVESITRPDGMRMSGGVISMEGQWWERSSHFLCANTNKRGLTLDLSSPQGIELLRRLIAETDVVIENFTPRVMANFGLEWPTIQAINPRCVLVRMPAFGLSGPWRDNTGFAQTMEQVTGLAWLTGHTWDQPRIQRGPSDPNAGMHAAFAALVGLAELDATGEGCQLEVTMVEGALNAAAELAIEFSAYGNRLERDGNRSPGAAPQGLYSCAGFDRWLALSIATDEQWQTFVGLLGSPAWATDPELATAAGRRARHDEIDEHINAWVAERDAAETADWLSASGIPAALGRDPRLMRDHPQLIARGYYEEVDHPVVGRRRTPTVPFRYASVDHWLRAAAPTVGEHNHEILGGLLGLSGAELEQLEADGIIGTRPRGV